ncbi:WD40 repeat-like protein [Daedalea quercina L-15889]|uniref:non-specific serine/threonine protein kinase n=1 Tax=Daedalea quercina L-15889 TaxID=1314783 RepID=A0A165KRN1_9APHY|nr:WD40 repeat-like protein [Daedalea quercina L-15889]
MGNVQSLTRTTGALDSFVAELGGEIVYERSMGSARFLKTVKCRHRNGYMVVKIFVKPDPGLSLRKYHRRLKVEREALADLVNVYSYQAFVETDKAGYVFRQWVASSLYDRISTRPFLSSIDKKWIAFQLLHALRDARNRKISHGDIKSENILVTSWNWVYLTDFASYKPTYLPLDDPSDFSFFFDTSGRRTCYVAPERFYTAAENPEISAKKSKLAMEDGEGRRDGRVTEAMDCFSAGCVIAELFLEGSPLFTLSQLFKYREGELSVEAQLSAIDDEPVKNLIKQMIAVDPAVRPSFDTLLHTSRGSVFPESFYSFFHNYVSSINELSGPSPFASNSASTVPSTPAGATVKSPQAATPQALPGASTGDVSNELLPSDSDHGPALIVLALVTANIRNCTLPSSKLRGLDVLLALSPYLTDEAKLDRMVPYVVDLLHDDAAIVRAAAMRTLMQILMLVTVITPSNAAIFPEYIVPAVAHLVRDSEVSVRCMYAQCIVSLADTAVRYLEMGQALKAHGSYKLSPDTQEYDEAHFEVSYDASMQELQNSIQEHLSALLVDPSSVVKRAVLHNISSLCIFLGRQKTNDVLLSHMITYLNDRDWLLRYAFFDCIVDVAACGEGRSLEEYILPLMIQSLSDVEGAVVAKVLAASTSLCELGLFQKMRIWELMSATLGFLYHPNIWIRQGAAAFIASAAKHLPPSDVWCVLYPSLKHCLRSDVRDVDERSLLLALKPPLSRQVFDAAVQWAMKSEKSLFWRTHRGSKSESPKDSLATVRSSGSATDEAQLTKLHHMGMTSGEEAKLTAMRDYILKLARNMASFSSRVSVEGDAEQLKAIVSIELQKLGVVPQTVFLRGPRSVSKHGSYSDLHVRSPVPGTPRSGRTFSMDHTAAAVAPFEDLRRRLAIINGSATSVNATSPREARSPTMPSLDHAIIPSSASSDVPRSPVRPGSPTESIISITNPSASRPMRIGSIDGQKAAPAVGSSRANATGLLDAHAYARSDASPERSGRMSPLSPVPTIRPQDKLRPPSLTPITTHDGQEYGLNNLLEQIYMDNTRELQNDFGPHVHEGAVRRRNAARHSFMSRDGSSRRPETTLIAHLSSHIDAVTGIAVSPDHMFFVSASDDKTLKVWDTARLERNVTSKPRQTYGQHHAKVKCVCALEGLHCFASAADDGSLHVVRVHVTHSGSLPKYHKLQLIREHRLEQLGEYITCMAHFMTDTSSSLVYTTTHSVISILDLRTMRQLQKMENPRHYGPITCLCLDRKHAWVICGTSTGVLSLWDIRFGILIKSWRVGAAFKGGHAKVCQCVVHPVKGKGKWVIVTLEAPKSASTHVIMEVWDVERSLLVEAFSTRRVSNAAEELRDPYDITGEEAESNPATAIAALVRARQENGGMLESFAHRGPSGALGLPDSLYAMSPNICTVVVGTEFGGHAAVRSTMTDQDVRASRPSSGKGFLLSGSEDRRIRYWDLSRVERSAVLTGMEADNDKPVYSGLPSASSSEPSRVVETWISSPSAGHAVNRPPQRLSLISHNQNNLLRGHQDTITALACIDSPFRGGIVSGDRSGAIKIWRVEGLDLS